jgi:hypothetical protein
MEQVEIGNDLSDIQKRRQLTEELLATVEKILQHSLVVPFNNAHIPSCNIELISV